MQTKQITANIPAKTGFRGQKIAARTETLRMDDAGQWSIDFAGQQELITEAEAIDVLRKASNWDDIRREHFPMLGFHA